MELGILTTSRCNVACRHCATSCGPQRVESLARAKILSLVDEAAALSAGEPLSLKLSGGEPFLDFDLLLDVVAHAHRAGAAITVVTNGSWATSHEKACAMLKQLKEAGLTHFAVSTSPFHQEFVKRARIERVLAASREVGVPCKVKYVRVASDPQSPESIRAWALAAGAESVQELPLLPHLREGESAPESEYTRKAGLPEGRCPAPLLTVAETGAAYTCCTPGGFEPLLALGSVHESELAEVHDRFYLGGVQQILRAHGPAHFAQEAQARGFGDRLRASYESVCDLCTHIASDPELSALAAEVAEQFEVQRIEEVFAA